MNETTTTMETAAPATPNTPNQIEGSDLERKTGGADMEFGAALTQTAANGMEQARSDEEQARSDEDEDAEIRSHFDRIWAEAERFAKEVPGFDLARELADDGFVELLSPRRGLTLEQAYFVRHGRALLAAAERAAEARVSAALQASRRMPAPLGAAAASPGFRWDKSSDAKAREALKTRIRKGEKIYPGR